jgi:hypothetical protein
LKTKEEALDRTEENSLWKRHIWTCRKTDNEMNECVFLDSTALCDRNKRQPQLFSATEITSSPRSRRETCWCHTRNRTLTGTFDLLPSEYTRHNMLWHNQYEHSSSCWCKCCTHSAQERQTGPRHIWGGLSPATLSGGPDSIPVRSFLIRNGQRHWDRSPSTGGPPYPWLAAARKKFGKLKK